MCLFSILDNCNYMKHGHNFYMVMYVLEVGIAQPTCVHYNHCASSWSVSKNAHNS